MHRTRGFTLLELVVVVTIIGILAAIAIPRFASSKDRAYVSAMKSDLRNLVTAMESYQSDYAAYTTSLGPLNVGVSTGVTVVITSATATGWDATASHNATSKTCGVYIGTGTPTAVGAQPGETICN